MPSSRFEQAEADPIARSPVAVAVWNPPTDVLLTEVAVIVRIELAGTTPGAVRVASSDVEVVVSGHRRDPLGPLPRRINRMEIAFGPFERTIPLPVAVDADRGRARLVDGLLEVALPLAGPQAVRTRIVSLSVTSDGP